MRVRLAWLVALAAVSLPAAAGLPLAAQTDAYVKRGSLQREGRAWVEESTCGADVQEGGRLVLRTHMGSVRIKPGAADRMECQVRVSAFAGSEPEARALLSRFQLTVRRTAGGGVYLAGEAVPDYPRRVMWGVAYEIQVPLRFNADIETRAGGIEVERLEGELRAVTAGGDIRTGEVTGPVRAETAGGNIELGNIGQRLEARTAGGCVTVGDVKGDAVLETSGGQIIAGRIEGAARAETAGGDIILRSAGTNVIAQTAGGQIRLGETGGSVRAETSGGSILLAAARGPVRVETAGGSINLYRVRGGVEAVTAAGKILAQLAAGGENFIASALETSFGDVEVYIPPDLPLTVDATIEMASGHKISSDFPLEIKDEAGDYGPGTIRGRGAVNGGGEVLRLHTVAGNIEIRKLTPAVLQLLQERQNLLWEHWQEREQKRREEKREREVQREKRRPEKP